MDVARDLARVAAQGARPDHAAAHRRGASSSRTAPCAAPASRQPRIAVAALNPHAGENGLFGREEIEMIAPGRREGGRDAASTARGPSRPTPSSQGLRRRVRQRALDVPRPGADRDEAARASTAASPSRRGWRPSSPRPRTAPRSTSSARASHRPARSKARCALAAKLAANKEAAA